MKHYRVRGEGGQTEVRPRLIFDVKFDLRDMHTRNFESLEKSFVADLVPLDEDLLWTSDMVSEREGSYLRSNAEEIRPPEAFSSLIARDVLEAKFLQYLLEHHKIMVRRNSHYDLYSSPSESLEEFLGRCMDRAYQDRAEDFRLLADRFLRRLLQQEELVQRSTEEFEVSLEEPSQRLLEINKVFFDLKEQISSLSIGQEWMDR